tara:strand:- start:184 stop:468 length:285 start_codon:yes stop_codon:yes gene_type:complete
MKLLGKRPLTAEIFDKNGVRVVTPIVRCHLCGIYGYLGNKVITNDDAHADITLKKMPEMIVRKVTKQGQEYDSTCLPCIESRMYPDHEPKEAKK